MERYYQQEIETADREQVLAWQNERLVKQVRHVWDNVPYYRAKMEEKGVTPEDIQSVADLHKLPFLTKDDLREAYPYGLLAKPLKDCVRIQSTSGGLLRPGDHGGRRHGRRCMPCELRVWPFYRRAGLKRRQP